jgi:hypothetical protein
LDPQDASVTSSSTPRGEHPVPARHNEARVTVSDELPLTLLVAVLTAIVMSAVNAVPELLWIGVVVAPFIADVLKHWIAERGWGKRRLLALTGLLAGAGTTERMLGRSRNAAGAAAPGPSLAGIVIAASLSGLITIAAFTVVEGFRGGALLTDRPTTFLSAPPPRPDEEAGERGQTGFATPEDAIAAFAGKQGWNYERRCPAGFEGGELPTPAMCSILDRDPPAELAARLTGDERAFRITGWSNHEAMWLALQRTGGTWTVTRVTSAPPAPQPGGPISPAGTP